MIKRTFITCISVLCSFRAFAVPFNDGFAGSNINSYVDNKRDLMQDISLARQPGMHGKQVVQLTFDNEKPADFKYVALTPGTVNVLRFRASWDNDETVETNPTFEQALSRKWGMKYLPGYSILFYDKDKKELNRHLTGIHGVMPYGKWHDYRQVFFTPVNAVYMRLSIKAGLKGVLYIDNIQFNEQKCVDEALTMNFTEQGKQDGTVFGINSYKGQRLLDDGTYVFCGSPTPVPLGPGKYKLDLKTHMQPRAYHNLNVYFYNDKNKKIGEKKFGRKWTSPLEMSVPENTTSIKFQVWGYLLEEIKIIKTKVDANENE